jgi:hypothetical protein
MSCSIASLGRPFSVFQTNGETQKGEKKKFSKLTFSKCHCVPVKDGMIDFERGKKAKMDFQRMKSIFFSKMPI